LEAELTLIGSFICEPEDIPSGKALRARIAPGNAALAGWPCESRRVLRSVVRVLSTPPAAGRHSLGGRPAAGGVE